MARQRQATDKKTGKTMAVKAPGFFDFCAVGVAVVLRTKGAKCWKIMGELWVKLQWIMGEIWVNHGWIMGEYNNPWLAFSSKMDGKMPWCPREEVIIDNLDDSEKDFSQSLQVGIRRYSSLF